MREPSAAAQLLASGIPITLIPLDATNRVPMTRRSSANLPPGPAWPPAWLPRCSSRPSASSPTSTISGIRSPPRCSSIPPRHPADPEAEGDRGRPLRRPHRRVPRRRAGPGGRGRRPGKGRAAVPGRAGREALAFSRTLRPTAAAPAAAAVNISVNMGVAPRARHGARWESKRGGKPRAAPPYWLAPRASMGTMSTSTSSFTRCRTS